MFLSLKEHKSEPLGPSRSQMPSSVQQHEAWLYTCTTIDCWLLNGKHNKGNGKTEQAGSRGIIPLL